MVCVVGKIDVGMVILNVHSTVLQWNQVHSSTSPGTPVVYAAY